MLLILWEKHFGEADTPGFFVRTTTWGGDGSNYGLFIATATASWGDGNVEDWGKYYPNTWYHVVLVRECDTWIIYKNGENYTSGTKTGIGLNADNNVNFKIGDSTDAPNFNGIIDEVRIYNRALGASEVKAYYEALIIVTSDSSVSEITPTFTATETPYIQKAPPFLAFWGILIAFFMEIIAALLFPATSQSKIWIKILGSEWGAIAKGRIWTFISVLIVVALLWGFLLWIPTNP